MKCTVAVGLKNPFLNRCKRRPEIDRVGPRDVGEVSGGGGWPWVAAWAAVEGQKAQIGDGDRWVLLVTDRSQGWVH